MADERMAWRAVWVGDEGMVLDGAGRSVRVDEPGWHVVSDGDGPAKAPVVLRLDGVTHEDDPMVAEWVAGLLSASTGAGVRLDHVLHGSCSATVTSAAAALGVPDPMGAWSRSDHKHMRVVWTR